MRRATTLVVIWGVALAAGLAYAEEPPPSAPPAPAVAPGAPPPPTKLEEVFPPDPDAGKPVLSPFGDPWDPTRPPPVEPTTGGPGITSAKLVVSGDADIEEIPRPAGRGPVFYGVVVDVTVAPGSTTDVLGGASITLTPAAGDPAPLFAACMPTLEDASLITAGEGTGIAAWTIAIEGQTWRCGGRNARMIRRVGPGGFKLTGPAPSGWSGAMVLLFQGQAERPKSVTLAGRTIEIPARQDQKTN